MERIFTNRKRWHVSAFQRIRKGEPGKTRCTWRRDSTIWFSNLIILDPLQCSECRQMLIKSEGIVLRTTDYGETNKIVTPPLENMGKLVWWQEAQKSNSRLSAISQPFLYGTFLIQSSTGLGTLQQGEMIESMRTIREDLFLTAYAAYMTELLDKGTEEKSQTLICLSSCFNLCVIWMKAQMLILSYLS